jgi:pimeloyl-ACP methyl ester carboxylesterase
MTIEVQGASVHVVDVGAGPPLLMLHGNPNTSAMWRGVSERLRDRHRCLAPDLPGWGASSAPPDFDYSLESMAGFVDALLDAMGIAGPVDLLVHDIGGFFGLAWAVRHPARVRRICVTNTAFSPDFRWHFFGRVWRTPVLGELAMAMMTRFAFVREVRRGARLLSDEHIRGMYAEVDARTRRSILRLYRAIDPEVFCGWDEELRRLAERVPVLVVWGDQDPYIPVAFADRFGADRVVHLPDCGHWPPTEAPDELAAHLAAFLAAGAAAQHG